MRLLKLTSDESPVRGSPVILHPDEIGCVKMAAERGYPENTFTLVMTRSSGRHVVKESVDEVYQEWARCWAAPALISEKSEA